jgi:YVTN family beta-propeller protein
MAAAQVASASLAPWFHFESGAVTPLTLTADGQRLLVLNGADSRLEIWRITDAWGDGLLEFEGSVFTGLDPVAIELDPADGSRCYVANQLSDSVAVVDLDDRIVLASLEVGDEPHDLAIAGGRLFVACARARMSWTPGATSETLAENVVVALDLAAPFHAPVRAVLPVAGHTPRALAVSEDGTKVFVAPQNSGNRTSVLPLGAAIAGGLRQQDPLPGESFAINPILTSPFWGDLHQWLLGFFEPFGLAIGWNVPVVGRVVDSSHPQASFLPADHDVFVLDANTLAEVGCIDHVAGTQLALERRPGGNELWVAGQVGRNVVRFETVLKGDPIDNVVVRLDGDSHQVLQTFELAPPLTARHHGQPVALAFDPTDRDRVYVATLGTSTILALDVGAGTSFEIPGCDLPQGLAFDPMRRLLFALSRGDNTVRVFAVDDGCAEITVQELDHDPEPPLIRTGRRTLYGATVESGRGTGNASCASCHIFGHLDHLAWDLGNPEGGMSAIGAELHGFPLFFAGAMQSIHPAQPVNHPMKGPMMTQSLRNVTGDEPLHWRGDRNAFQSFRGAFKGLLGGSGISAEEMQAFTSFVGTMAHRPNPYQPAARAYSGLAEAGRDDFGEGPSPGNPYFPGFSLSCVDCHQADFANGVFTGSAPFVNFDAGTQMFNPSLLRSIYEKNHPELTGFGSNHEGSQDGVRGFLAAPAFTLVNSNPARFDAMVEFVNAFDTGVAPLVGQQVFATHATLQAARDWLDVAEERARRGELDLIGKGWLWVDGRREAHGGCFVSLPDGNEGWLIDNGGFLTREEMLSTYVKPGIAEAIFTCVLAGHGRRLGIDQDEDQLLDFIEVAGTGTDPSDPDSDDDGYTDSAEVWFLSGDPLRFDPHLADKVAPSVTGHGTLFTFAQSTTFWVAADEPVTVDLVIRDAAGAAVGHAASGELRAFHALAVAGLPAGARLDYEVVARDRNGNVAEATGGSLTTTKPQVHVDVLELEVAEQDGSTATVVGTVRIVDELGQPVSGMSVALLFEAEGTAGLGAWFDALAFGITDMNGVIEVKKRVADPEFELDVSMSPVALGSFDPSDAWYAGTVGEFDATFFYEEAANVRTYVTTTVK